MSGSPKVGVSLTTNPTIIASPVSVNNPVGGAIGVYGAAPTAFTVVNQSQISAAGLVAVGVGLDGGGSLSNSAAAMISGNFAAVAVVGRGTIDNAGTMAASGLLVVNGSVAGLPTPPSTGVGVPAGGTVAFGVGAVATGAGSSVTNELNGRITAPLIGVGLTGAASTLSNAGTIIADATLSNAPGLPATAPFGLGVALSNGSVDNLATGQISASAAGLIAFGTYGPATVHNAGLITGTGTPSIGMLLGSGGGVSNAVGGRIEGGVGIGIGGGSGYVANAGTIAGLATPGAGFVVSGSYPGTGVLGAFLAGTNLDTPGVLRATGVGLGILAGGEITNAAGGVIQGVDAGLYATGGTASTGATVINSGVIFSTGPQGIGVVMEDGTFANLGGVAGSAYGLALVNQPNDLLNAGNIHASGVVLSGQIGNPFVTELGMASVAAGTTLGVGVIAGNGATIVNGAIASGVAGTITGAVNGIEVLRAGASIANAVGTIAGAGAIGIALGQGGEVINGAGQLIEGFASGLLIVGSAGGTVVNAGSIAGTNGASADAVLFSNTGTDMVEFMPAAVFRGGVVGSTLAGAFNVLALGSAAATGTLSGLGTEFSNFNEVTLSPGASWSLAGDNALGANGIFTGTGTIANLGTLIGDGAVAGTADLLALTALVNSGAIVANTGTLEVLTAIQGTGEIVIAPGAALGILGSVTSGQTIDFVGDGGRLGLGQVAQFAGTLGAFGALDTIDLLNTPAVSANFTPGELVVTLNSGATIQFAAANVAAGATVTVVPNGLGTGEDLVIHNGGSVGAGTLDLSPYSARAQAAAASAIAALSPAPGLVTYAEATSPTGFGPAHAGVANIAVLTAPVAGSTASVPTGFAGLAVTGSTALTLTDSGTGHALLLGNQGADTISGTGSGSGGGDTLVGGQGADTFIAGTGDSVVTGDGHNLILAAGADSVTTGTGQNLAFLGGANDMVVANGADTIVGSNVTGQTEFLNAAGAEVFGGNSGANTVVNSGGQDTVAAGNGPETIFANAGGGLYELNGSPSLEFVGNTTGTGTILGGSGQATLFGGSGRYVYFMGGETTEFAIQQGAATMVGGAGNASVWAGTGGPDVFFQNGGSLLYDAQSSQSTVVSAASAPADVFFAGAGGAINVFSTSNGNVFVGYGSGNTTLNGGGATGSNVFFAGSGNTTIFGGAGQDSFVAGSGNAVMVAGSGANAFEFTAGRAGGFDVLAGFTARDAVYLFGYGANAIAGESSTGGSTTVTLADNTRILFQGIASLNLAQIHSF